MTYGRVLRCRRVFQNDSVCHRCLGVYWCIRVQIYQNIPILRIICSGKNGYKPKFLYFYTEMITAKLRYILLFLLLVIGWAVTYAQSSATNRAYWAYIDQYKDIAIEQMQKHRIPASITLAQGLFESGAGRSTLVTEAHNHFGIKTPGGWTGPYVIRDDDRRGEHFRKYKTDRESFEDHSLFLEKPRYKVLFTYKMTDYRSWAHGLKDCGYATNPQYANQLIHIIELYNLQQFDTMKPGQKTLASEYLEQQNEARSTAKSQDVKRFYDSHMVYMANGNYFIIIKEGDTLEGVAQETGISRSNLRKYNDLPKRREVSKGDIIYPEPKKNKADKQYAGVPHTVEAGQSMYDIAQLYGIRLKSLYKLNGLSTDYTPQVGDLIWVR